MGLLSWIVVGGLAGWLAGNLVKGRGFGCLGNIIVGVVGALIGGWIAQMLGGSDVTGLNLYSIIVSVIGAVILLWIVGMVRGRKTVA